ncbi:MAG: glycosyl hydrolase family 35 [Bacteroides uniformis]|nr:glycosyl hydrolase family 35 [Bacteroides uniformis]
MKKYFIPAALFAGTLFVNAQNYHLNITQTPDKVVTEGKLKLGGSNPDGHKIGINSYYMTIDGKPMIATMGEMHYSRLPREEWEEQILKLKAGGINTLATYVFWALHEPKEGESCWEGNLDLRYFLELCKKHNMWTIVRIGPFCHGEMRSGSIPDWIYGRTFQIRTNDEEYLKYVDRHYENIAKQLQGHYYQEGGIVIGIQLENELQHSASPWPFGYPGQPLEFTVADYDVDNTHIGVQTAEQPVQAADMGQRHFATLKALSESKGIKAPLTTATGWGYAAMLPNESLPVTSCYPYNWWDAKLSPSRFYLFKDMTIEPDYSPVRYNPGDYPSFSAEMGIGNQHVYWRRVTPPDASAEAMVVRALGSGSNGVGYYMYQGGTTPRNENGFQSDHPMGVPLMSYDFKAPLAEFGFTRPTYRGLKLLHLFTNDFGNILAPMGIVLPEDAQTIMPTDQTKLRYAVRKKENSGFVFINNFQDHSPRINLRASIEIETSEGIRRFPSVGEITFKKDMSAIFPFNLEMNGAVLLTATAQPLAVLTDGAVKHYFFFAPDGIEPEFIFDTSSVRGRTRYTPTPGINSTVKVKPRNGDEFYLTTLTRSEALDAFKIKGNNGCERLVITNADLMQYDDKVVLQQTSPIITATVFSAKVGKKPFVKYTFENKPIEIKPIITTSGDRRMKVCLPKNAYDGVSELYLVVDYTGDTMQALVDGEMVSDNFWDATPWQIGLKRFESKMSKGIGLNLYMTALHPDATFLADIEGAKSLDFSKGKIARFNNVKIVPEYKVEFNPFNTISK